jgi:eukaryotic-like serine/threonine-protein kinase
MTSQARLVGGRYEEGESLGRGGMADVRKGVDNRLGRTVAIKRLRIDLASDPTFQARFRREAQSAASLNHPSIVAVYDTGEEPDPNGSGVTIPYIVMEYVAGKTLRDLLREGRKILPERALEITSGVLEALDYSHRAGIVHRDIKPGNVMLTPHGQVKVMDFGIARAVADTSATMTQTAAVIGTAQYLSPEQARGESVDARSDLYSTGCLLYELLTGRPPFVGESPVSVAYQHVREEPTPPSALDPDISPEIDAVVLKALAKNREYRYQSAAEMRSDIHRLLAGQQVTAPMATVNDTRMANAPTMAMSAQRTAVAAPVADPYGGPPDDDDPGTARRGRGFAYFLLGLAIVALAVGGYLLWDNLSNNDVRPPQVAVPNLERKTKTQALELLTGAKLTLGKESVQASTDVPRGQIMDQTPGAQVLVGEGTKVDIVISGGPKVFQIPNVVGMKLGDARDTLRNAEGQFSVDSKEVDSDKPEGEVVKQSQTGQAARGTTITLEVSRGLVQVPDVVGLPYDEAKKTLEDDGFKVDKRDTRNEDFEANEVVQQRPNKDTFQEKGTKITLWVNTEEEQPPPTQSTNTPPTTQPTSPTIPTLPTTPPTGEGEGRGRGRGNGEGEENGDG